MAWEDILLGEVDTNSPITSSLMTRIKNNLDWLKSALVGWSVANCWDEVNYLAPPVNTWFTVKTIKTYIPAWASKLHFKIKGKTTTGGTVKFRLKDSDTTNKSGETTTTGSSWTWLNADWSNPPTGWNNVEIQAYDTQGGDLTKSVSVGELVIIVSELS